MKKLFLICCFISYSHAQNPKLDDCIQDGQAYAGKNLVQKKCFDLAFEQAPEKSRDEVSDSKKLHFRVTGLKNLLYIQIESPKSPAKQHLISGEKSGLHEILSVGLSPYSDAVAVLNKNVLGKKEIRVFDRTMSGNVGPIHYFDLPEIDLAMNLFYHSSNKEIWFTRSDGFVSSLHSEADSRTTHKKPKLLVNLNFQEISGEQPLALAFVNQQLIILGQDGKHLYTFKEPLEKKLQFDAKFVIPASAPKGINTLRYSVVKDILVLLNDQSEVLEIPYKVNFE